MLLEKRLLKLLVARDLLEKGDDEFAIGPGDAWHRPCIRPGDAWHRPYIGPGDAWHRPYNSFDAVHCRLNRSG